MSRFVLPEYRFKWPQLDWWNNENFDSYLEKFGEREGLNGDRRWMLYQLTRLVADVPGDTAECGVFHGAGSYVICKANEQNRLRDRHHHMFDSFAGLSPPAEEDGSHWTAGDLSATAESVRQNLAGLTGFTIYEGWIPTRFREVETKSFCFVHIDVDLYQPTLDSLAFFYERMSPGGIVVCDDYGFTTCPGATRAVDEFLSDKPEKMLALPDGGGFFVKGVRVGAPAAL